MLLALAITISSAWASTDGAVYRAETEEGIIVFTDSPPQNALRQAPAYEVFYPGGPPPKVGSVNTRSFPLLDSWDSIITAAAQRHGLPSALIKAVVLAESGMNPNALSTAAAQGPTQLMPQTAAGLGVLDPYDPEQNVDGGARYLKKQLESFGATPLALAAYNAGPGNVRRHGGIPPFDETRTYVDRVLDLYAHFRDVAPIGVTP